MKFVGIDIGSEKHFVAVVDADGAVLVKATPFGEDAEGYAKLGELLDEPQDSLVAMEATGHYWQNLFAQLAGHGFRIALLNPLRTARFAEEANRLIMDFLPGVPIAHPVPSLAFAPHVDGYEPSPVQDEVWNMVTLTEE